MTRARSFGRNAAVGAGIVVEYFALLGGLFLIFPSRYAVLATAGAWIVAGIVVTVAETKPRGRTEWRLWCSWFAPHERRVFRATFNTRWGARFALRWEGFRRLRLPGGVEVYTCSLGEHCGPLWQVVAIAAGNDPEGTRAIAEMHKGGGGISVDMCLYRDGYQVLPETPGCRWLAPYLGEDDQWAKIHAAHVAKIEGADNKQAAGKPLQRRLDGRALA